MTGELRSLTSARGIAAWMVVIYHIRSGANWAPAWLMEVAHKGYLAVDFFFLLSGFVIYLSAHRAMLSGGASAIPAFLARRFARIYPLYGVMLGLTVMFALLLRATGREDANYPWAELPLHIAMMQNWGFTPALSWNHPAWSISAEFAAYLLFPALVLWTPLSRARRPNLLAAMIALLATLHILLAAFGEQTLGGDIPRFGLLRCLIEFSCGAVLCAFWLRGPDRDARAMTIAFTGAIMFWGQWLSGLGSETWAFPAGAACLILALAHASTLRRNPLHWRPLHYLGEISYATYMVHFMLFIWFKIAFVKDATAIPPVTMAAFLALTFAASVLLYHLVERPGRRWLGAVRLRLPARPLQRQP
ncbi:acyltransferase family protein [Sphingobium phenoxybenzoativorans]|uniref:acyltransferase family protein n=1 Tax=Sphingobium phenoxybenzoativorans TaxID=1592790 RepID=UPI0008732E28|nr:acyltransferase [Sphingobium phenoxybenzoativorans]